MSDPLRKHLMIDAPVQGQEVHSLAKDVGITLKWNLLRLDPSTARKRAALEIAKHLMGGKTDDHTD